MTHQPRYTRYGLFFNISLLLYCGFLLPTLCLSSNVHEHYCSGRVHLSLPVGATGIISSNPNGTEYPEATTCEWYLDGSYRWVSDMWTCCDDTVWLMLYGFEPYYLGRMNV